MLTSHEVTRLVQPSAVWLSGVGPSCSRLRSGRTPGSQARSPSRSGCAREAPLSMLLSHIDVSPPLAKINKICLKSHGAHTCHLDSPDANFLLYFSVDSSPPAPSSHFRERWQADRQTDRQTAYPRASERESRTSSCPASESRGSPGMQTAPRNCHLPETRTPLVQPRT